AASQVGPFDQLAYGYGLRVLLRLRRRRRQPNLFRNTNPDLPVPGQGPRGVEPHHGDGRRRHRLDDPDAPDRPVEAAVHQVRAGRHGRDAPPTEEWVEKIRAMKLFDDGYEKLRERKRLGVIPKNTKLAPWPKEHLKPWDQLTADEKKLF